MHSSASLEMTVTQARSGQLGHQLLGGRVAMDGTSPVSQHIVFLA